MTRNLMILLSAGGSAALLAGAFLFQALGYPPCAMCLWQRWPHAAAILIGVLALRFPGRVLPLLGALAAATTAAIGVFHTGVERDWWEGPSSCTGGSSLEGLTGADLLSVAGPRVVMCDQVSWELFSLSMASWNVILSLVLMIGWIIAFRLSAASTTKGSSRIA
ncbi:disulfide bond formation protein DsbB [Loktanella sp. PT4BL]|jgi:disulfide bond formation protein DsbB|uniref:disulfide bond formation protein B n=1 Tax=Loktanella sp. PT4BL TaxID=2135611 RepID=UPI000D75BC3F|nr:disulfide bond formation protein B [Loktanella sp. PT4BL]PXW70379.1 disulfide bond formation protein DsbB [Loktanella sp. PT4BL]